MDFVTRPTLAYAVYFAPRGKIRLFNLGHQISQRYLSPLDRLIGFIGDAGAGKSLLIKGMFPGLELTNDDDGINIRPLPIIRGLDDGFFESHTYHIDIRFEQAFTQMHEIAEAVKKAVDKGKRVIVEHFDLLYPCIGMNAEIIIGVGEEVIITRPSIFGPLPSDIADIVFKSIKIRKMVHTAEDLTCHVIEEDYDIKIEPNHDDVKHGFVLEFDNKPNIDIEDLQKRVQVLIDSELDVCFEDDGHIKIGEKISQHCTGPRIHVSNTGEIINFQLIREIKYDQMKKVYSIVGLVGDERPLDINDINKLII